MNKLETLDYIKEKKGFVPYVTLFDMFDNDDEIPQHLIDMSIKKNENTNFLIGNEKLVNLFKNIK